MSNTNNTNLPNYYTGNVMPVNQAAFNQNFVNNVNKEQLKLLKINKVVPSKRGTTWGGLSIRPERVQFQNQNSDEKVFVVIRSHWSANVGWIVRNMFYSLIPFLIAGIISFFDIKLEFLTIQSTSILLLIFYSAIFTNVVRCFFDWYFDPYIVTNQRIVHFEFKPFSSYTVKETELYNIQFISERSAGVLASIFNYGDITVATESEKTVFEFRKIPHSTLVRDIIEDLRRIDQKYHG